MKRITTVAAGACLALLAATTLPALSATHEFTGRVLHVSADNIKVEAQPSGHVMSFMIVPHFDQAFQFDGKTTYQMKRIHPGTHVHVYYDERVFGMRHADRIVVMDRAGTHTLHG